MGDDERLGCRDEGDEAGEGGEAVDSGVNTINSKESESGVPWDRCFSRFRRPKDAESACWNRRSWSSR